MCDILTTQFSFLKLYVMGSTQVDLLDIVLMKVEIFAVAKMYTHRARHWNVDSSNDLPCIRAFLGKFV